MGGGGGEGEGAKLRDQLENCLKMHYFLISHHNFYKGGEFLVQKYLTLNRPGFSESGKARGLGGGGANVMFHVNCKLPPSL